MIFKQKKNVLLLVDDSGVHLVLIQPDLTLVKLPLIAAWERKKNRN